MKRIMVIIVTILLALGACTKKENVRYSRHKKNNTNQAAEMKMPPDNALLGIMSSPVKRIFMTSQIRLTGKIANDGDLYNAQQEYLSAFQNGDKDILESAAYKLKLLGYKSYDMANLQKAGTPDKNLIYPGARAWVIAEIYEMDIGKVRNGQSATLSTSAYPGETFQGTVRYIEPALNPVTRTAKARILVSNPGEKLKLEMYVNLEIHVNLGYQLAVSRGALIDTGSRKFVFKDLGDHKYKIQDVKTGFETDEQVQILSGLKEKDMVVEKGNFLLDSQSTLSGGLEIIDQSGGSDSKSSGKMSMPGMNM